MHDETFTVTNWDMQCHRVKLDHQLLGRQRCPVCGCVSAEAQVLGSDISSSPHTASELIISSGYLWHQWTSAYRGGGSAGGVGGAVWVTVAEWSSAMQALVSEQPRNTGRFKASGFGLNSLRESRWAFGQEEEGAAGGGGGGGGADFYLLPDREREEARRMSYSCSSAEPVCCALY